MLVSVCTGAHMCWGQRLASHVLLYCCPPIFSETGSLSETKNIQLGRQAGQWATEIFWSPPLVLGLQTWHFCLGFTWMRGPELNPYLWVRATLASEPSPQPQCAFYLVRVNIVSWNLIWLHYVCRTLSSNLSLSLFVGRHMCVHVHVTVTVYAHAHMCTR